MSPASPSPIKSYDGHCVKPQEGSCSPKDGSRVIFTEKGECAEDFMEFSLDEEGVLRHHCSGKMVCPERDSIRNGARLHVSTACNKEDSKYERTAGATWKANHHYAILFGTRFHSSFRFSLFLISFTHELLVSLRKTL